MGPHAHRLINIPLEFVELLQGSIPILDQDSAGQPPPLGTDQILVVRRGLTGNTRKREGEREGGNKGKCCGDRPITPLTGMLTRIL